MSMSAKEENAKYKVQEDIRHKLMSASRIYSFGFLQFGRQQLVFLGKLFMLRKEFLEKLRPSIGAKLVRKKCQQNKTRASSRVILTLPESRGLGEEYVRFAEI